MSQLQRWYEAARKRQGGEVATPVRSVGARLFIQSIVAVLLVLLVIVAKRHVSETTLYNTVATGLKEPLTGETVARWVGAQAQLQPVVHVTTKVGDIPFAKQRSETGICYAVSAGKVVTVQQEHLIVEATGGIRYYYRLQRPAVQLGAHVAQGTSLGQAFESEQGFYYELALQRGGQWLHEQ